MKAPTTTDREARRQAAHARVVASRKAQGLPEQLPAHVVARIVDIVTAVPQQKGRRP